MIIHRNPHMVNQTKPWGTRTTLRESHQTRGGNIGISTAYASDAPYREMSSWRPVRDRHFCETSTGLDTNIRCGLSDDSESYGISTYTRDHEFVITHYGILCGAQAQVI